MIDPKSHWDKIYSSKPFADLSWYTPHLLHSLEFIRRSGVTHGDSIIDVGGGASTLVDDLIGLGFRSITVLDISPRAIEVSRHRLGERASEVNWIADDILRASLPHGMYGLWHDRAVFHFLTDQEDRREYIRKVRLALSPRGFVVISTFSPDGPPKCSGLEVRRYSPESLVAEFGDGFRLLDAVPENHRTPSGTRQAFNYFLLSREEDRSRG